MSLFFMENNATKKSTTPTPQPTQDDLDWMIRNIILPYQKAKKEKRDPCATSASTTSA